MYHFLVILLHFTTIYILKSFLSIASVGWKYSRMMYRRVCLPNFVFMIVWVA